LLCIERNSWKKLKELLDLHKRSYSRTRHELQTKETAATENTYKEDSLRVIMSNWYHGQFGRIKTRNCTEEQLWGDLSVEQEMELKRILKGEF
jgi:hypothetical protein